MEDHGDLAFGLMRHLEFDGHAVDVASDGAEGLRVAMDDRHDLIILDLMLLLARVDALLRRASVDAADVVGGPHHFGDVVVDDARRSVLEGGAVVSIAPRELDLLIALLRADGDARSRETLLRDVWGHRARVATRTVDTHIGELRRKLEDGPGRPRHILTVRKFGYRLDAGGGD